MPRINEYPETQSLSNDDKFLIDTGDGEYKSIKASNLAYNVQASALGPIYNAESAQNISGVPASIALADLVSGIGDIASAKYASGKADAESVTWQETMIVNPMSLTGVQAGLPYANVVKIKNISGYQTSILWWDSNGNSHTQNLANNEEMAPPADNPVRANGNRWTVFQDFKSGQGMLKILITYQAKILRQ